MTVLRSSFFWQFAGGFVLGTLGLLAIQPAPARHHVLQRLERPHRIAAR